MFTKGSLGSIECNKGEKYWIVLLFYGNSLAMKFTQFHIVVVDPQCNGFLKNNCILPIVFLFCFSVILHKLFRVLIPQPANYKDF